MRLAWEATTKTPVSAGRSSGAWNRCCLPVGKHLDAAKLQAALDSPDTPDKDRLAAASNLAWLKRCQAGKADGTELSATRARA